MKKFWEQVLDLIFPDTRKCSLCHQKSGHSLLCPACYHQLYLLTKQEFCQKCGKFILKSKINHIRLCQDCFTYEYPFDFARACGPYRGIIKEMVYRFKYSGVRSLGNVLADLMVEVILKDKRFNQVDLIIPVPLAAGKLSYRGFNQAEILADRIARLLRIKIDKNNLVRIKETPSQSKLARQDRIKNIIGAFSLKAPNRVWGKNVLLVDDIFTTGSTVSECSRVLLAAGAQSIKVIALAAGEDINERGNKDESAQLRTVRESICLRKS